MEANRKIRSKNLNTQLSTYSGSGVLQSIHLTKNCVLAISIRGKLNTRRTRVKTKASKNQNRVKMERIRNQRKDSQEIDNSVLAVGMYNQDSSILDVLRK